MGLTSLAIVTALATLFLLMRSWRQGRVPASPVGLARRAKDAISVRGVAAMALGTSAIVILGGIAGTPAASAAQPSVGLGAATPFAVLAGQTVTNTGPSVISGSLGVSPGSAVTGFPPGTVNNGTQHAADAVALQAQSDLTTAYNDAAGRTPATVQSNPDLGGTTLVAGVYKVASAMSLTGTVTLDGQSNPNAVFIFQAGSTLITATNSKVALIGGAQPCNVFWQVGSSATLNASTTFVGTIMALTSASLLTGATVAGRVLARNGSVTLDSNTITQPTCTTATTTATTTPNGHTATTVGGGSGGGGSGGGLASGAVVPGGTPSTGAGGASHSGDSLLVGLGGLALLGAGVAMGLAIRRRRMLPASIGPDGSNLGSNE